MSDENEVVETTSPFPDAGIVTIGKKTYAAGLIWSRVDDIKLLISSAKISASGEGADLYTIRKSSNQFGLGSTTAGHKANMPSLADTLISGVDGTTWTGIFPIGEETYYFIAVQNNIILAGQDKIIHGRDKAIDDFSNLFLRGNWEHAFAPKEFSLNREVDDKSLEDVLGSTKNGITLKTLSSRNFLIKIAGFMFILALLFYGYQQYQSYQEAQEMELAQAQQASINAEKERLRLSQKSAPSAETGRPIPTYANKASYSDMLNACVSAVLKSPTQIPGWKPVAVSCYGIGPNEGFLTMNLARDGGTVNWIIPFLPSKDYRIGQIGQSGNVTGVEIKWPVPDYNKIPRYSEQLVAKTSLDDVLKYLGSNGEENFINFKVADLPSQVMEIVGPDNKPQQVPVLKGLSFSIVVRHDPNDLIKIISSIPVAIINKVSLDLTGWNWTIEGSAYETVPLPSDAKLYQKPATPTQSPRPTSK